MKCLNEYQLEQIFSGEKGIKVMLWKKHLKTCPICLAKYKEIKDNLEFSKSVKWDYRGESK